MKQLSSHYEPKLSVSDMICKGIPDAEILAIWLDRLGHPEYLAAFLTQGYDLSTVARITPEDLIALGITQPTHRKLLISEIHRWHITDAWPTVVSSGELRFSRTSLFLDTQFVVHFALFNEFAEVQNLTWEDFEDIGIKKLGHLKRLGLAIKKMKVSFKKLYHDDMKC
ncbi:unnamed protein product [Gongylonema pulchrum]|uniref:SAM domain-containing protein n=1 Tax=Gongylonema pulchrum TaxID=637853 RepID=A0A183ERP9_9BILA|nr:unnamed protein product [Gongylonema pulchrum]